MEFCAPACQRNSIYNQLMEDDPKHTDLCECNRVVCTGDCIFAESCIHCLVAKETRDIQHLKFEEDARCNAMAPSLTDNCFRNPIESDVYIGTTEMHTGGMPVRVIESGFPVPQGGSVKEKVEHLQTKYDHYRKMVIHEPHGHRDMYGVLLVAPTDPEADVGAIFMDNKGYATMCGHATISFARYVLDRGLVRRPITSPETQVNIQAPCGLVKAFVQVTKGETYRSGRTRFESVPAFVIATDVQLEVENVGTITIDVSYGGSFYAFVTAADVGVDLYKTSSQEIARIGTAIKAAAIEKVQLHHPQTKAFFYGTMFVDSRTELAEGHSTNVCIFADAATDRSPCGSGTTARIALMYHRGLLSLGQSRVFKCGATGSEFIGCPVRETTVGDNNAVVVEISGQGRYIGNSTLTLEREDLLGKGFVVN